MKLNSVTPSAVKPNSSWLILILAPLLLMGAAGCASQVSPEANPCVLAETVATTPIENQPELSQATQALADALPAEQQASARILAQPVATVEEFTAEQAQRMQALVEVQGWVMENCQMYLTIGAPVDAGLSVDAARLADFQTVIGSDDDGVYVSVLGVDREDIALELCQQALREHSRVGAEDGAEAHVQILDPIGQITAYSAGGECALAAGPGDVTGATGAPGITGTP